MALSITLLVVPRLTGQAGASTLYLRWLHRLARAGHELALHGLTHQDAGPAMALDATPLRQAAC